MSDSLKIHKLNSEERKFVERCDLIKAVIRDVIICVLGLAFLWTVHDALNARPETLSQFAECLKACNIPGIIKALLAVLGYGGWWLEKRRNRRLVRKEGDLRREKEYHDPVSTRSGLDKFGLSPADKGEKAC